MSLINNNQLSRILPTNREISVWLPLCNEMFAKYEINTPNRIAHFLAQTGHESADFKVISENLNYSASRLLQVFGNYFKNSIEASKYAYQPEKLANYVYNDANRKNKLGNVNIGDGWRFRGAGLMQLTGRSNFTNFARHMNMSVEEAADYCRTKRGALESACWFWKNKNLNSYADKDLFTSITRLVNGGDNGIADRRSRMNTAKTVLSSDPIVLGFGSRGNEVVKIQRFLGITADGIFGSGTHAAVKNWQRRQGFAQTGDITQSQLRLMV